jgi:hypothetical protein
MDHCTRLVIGELFQGAIMNPKFVVTGIDPGDSVTTAELTRRFYEWNDAAQDVLKGQELAQGYMNGRAYSFAKNGDQGHVMVHEDGYKHEPPPLATLRYGPGC